jgi:hypothetical protein
MSCICRTRDGNKKVIQNINRELEETIWETSQCSRVCEIVDWIKQAQDKV